MSAFRAGEEEAFALLAAIDEVHMQAEVEAFRVVEEGKQNIVGVAAVFPVANGAGGHGARGPCARDEVRAAEKMDEEVAGYA